MKKIFLLFLILSFSVVVSAQSKKEVKTYKIKSTTTLKAENKNGETVTQKDSYEEFDKEGRTTLSIEYKTDGTIKSKKTTTYDANDNESEECEYDATGMTQKTLFVYNANGDKTGEIISDASGNIVKKVTYTYDAKGLKESKQTFNASNILESVKKYVYAY